MNFTYKKLWKLLIDRNIKKSDFPKIVGISPATVTKLNKGKNVTTETLFKICSALNCELKDIMEQSKSEDKTNG